MRIAIIGLYPLDNQIKGGVEGVVHALGHQLALNQGNEVHIITPGIGSNISIEQYGSLTIYRLPQRRLPGFLNYWTVQRWSIHKLLNNIQPDIAHFHGLAGWLIGYNGPHLFTVHGIAEKDVLYSIRSFRKLRSIFTKFIENIGRNTASDIVLISPYVKKELLITLKSQLHNIENPIDLVFFCPLDQLTPRTKRLGHIVTAGSVSERKNTLTLLHAFNEALIKNPELSLSIAGSLDDIEYVKKCREYIKNNGLENSVKLLSNLDRPKLAELYRSAAAFILVSKQETAPMAIAEAMACGTPIIGSNICGIPYMVEQPITGTLVDPNEISSIATAIVSIATNVNYEPASISDFAYKRFHPTYIARRTFDLYLAIIDREKLKCRPYTTKT